MFCPRCGQQPANDRIRFCPSCGLRLDGVVNLLLNDGVPTNPLAMPAQMAPPPPTQPSPRRKGMRRGGKLLFTSLAIFLPLFGFSILIGEPFPLLLPSSLFLAGIFWMLYCRLFEDDYATPVQTLPPPPAQTYMPPPRTPVFDEIAQDPQRGSVVDQTTRSLKQH